MVCAVSSTVKSENSQIDKNSPDNTNSSEVVIIQDETIMENEDDGYKLTKIAGGSLIDYPPLFSPDGQSVFVVNQNIVQVFSSSTGEWVKDMEIGTTNNLIGIQYDLTNSKILIGCSWSGEIVKWKWKTGSVELKKTLPFEDYTLLTFNMLELWSNSPCALITYSKPRIYSTQFALIDIMDGSYLDCPLDIKLSSSLIKVVAETKSFYYFAFAQDDALHVVNYKTWHYKRWRNASRSPITAIICHPSEELLATGDDMGRIFIWRELWSKHDPRTSLYHWHHTPITSLCFTELGTGIYSGGQEAVLVKWKIKRPDLKEFVPRLVAPIVHIAIGADNLKIAIATSDNGIQIMGPQHQTNCVLQSFTFVADQKTGLDKYPIGLQLNPRTNSLVLSGRIGHLQFYSTYTKSLLYNLDIVVQNRLSIEARKVLYDIRVTQAAFNVDWMATGEVWDDQDRMPELRLKFWQYEEQKQTYSLNTNIELPHEKGFKAIQFSTKLHSENLLCATVGTDNIIKIWSLEAALDIYKKDKKVWYCIAQTKYKNFNINSIDFSEDGSLLSAGYGNNLCIYRSANLNIKTVLTAPSGYDGSIQKIQINTNKNTTKNSNSQVDNDRQKILELFKKYIQKNDGTLLKGLKDNKKDVNKIRKHKIGQSRLNQNDEELLFKKIQSIPELNLFQKILLYQKMNIFCNISPVSHKKMFKYLSSTIFKMLHKEKDLINSVTTFSNRDRFKAKYRTTKLTIRKKTYNSQIDDHLVPILEMLGLREYKFRPIINNCNGNAATLNGENCSEEKIIIPQLQSTAQIRSVSFAAGEFSHLVIVCTEHRILIWNLLTLKLQFVLKLSAAQIIVDPLTSLCAVFTKHKELYVFLPNAPMSLYHRIKMPSILGACWVPRRMPKAQSLNIDWQSVSTLYFLTKNQELMCLQTNDDDDDLIISSVTYLNEPQEMVRYATFGTYAINKMKASTNSNLTGTQQNTLIGMPGKSTVKSFIEMAPHTMAPINILCKSFVKSLFRTDLPDQSTTNQQSQHTNSTITNLMDNDLDDIEIEETNSRKRISKIIADKTQDLLCNKKYSLDHLKSEQRSLKCFNEELFIQF